VEGGEVLRPTGPSQRVQAIRERAYAIWEQEGYPHGKDVSHWLLAEAENSAAEALESSALTAYLKTVVLPIVVICPDGSPKYVGTASIVASDGRQLLILTARHNIDHLKKIDQPYGGGAHATMPELFRPELPKDQFIRNTDAFLLFPFQGGRYSALGNAAINPDFDISLASCILPDGISPPIPLGIDTTPPQAGMQGFAAAYVGVSARTIELGKTTREGHWQFEGKFSLNACQVIASLPGGTSLYGRPCFQIDRQIPSGMSGGPVINFPYIGHPAICGVLLSDLSIGPDMQTASGDTAIAAALWISVALSMWVERSNGSNEEWTLLDLIKKGVVTDFGAASFELKNTKDGKVGVQGNPPGIRNSDERPVRDPAGMPGAS
jgi:hypothetical protein